MPSAISHIGILDWHRDAVRREPTAPANQRHEAVSPGRLDRV